MGFKYLLVRQSRGEELTRWVSIIALGHVQLSKEHPGCFSNPGMKHKNSRVAHTSTQSEHLARTASGSFNCGQNFHLIGLTFKYLTQDNYHNNYTNEKIAFFGVKLLKKKIREIAVNLQFSHRGMLDKTCYGWDKLAGVLILRIQTLDREGKLSISSWLTVGLSWGQRSNFWLELSKVRWVCHSGTLEGEEGRGREVNSRDQQPAHLNSDGMRSSVWFVPVNMFQVHHNALFSVCKAAIWSCYHSQLSQNILFTTRSSPVDSTLAAIVGKYLRSLVCLTETHVNPCSSLL